MSDHNRNSRNDDQPLDLSHDFQLQVATANSSQSPKWTNRTMSLSEFVEKLRQPVRTAETVEDYHRMPKAEQDRIKDVGGYVGAMLKGGRRSKEAVANRTIIALDADFASVGSVDKFATKLADVAYTVTSTHKHTDRRPRLRLTIYPDRPILPDEYQAVSRKLAERLDIDQFDDSTYDLNRLMYWPSVPRDADFVFYHNDAAPLPVDDVLAEYGPDEAWRNTTLWPQSSRENKNFERLLKKQQDPTKKKGVVGAWCRTVSIYDAIETELADVYTKEADGRYSYTEGTTTKGLVVYDDQFAYSHHSTDPAFGMLCNAFDLVRVHKFGHLDEDAKPQTPPHKMPSFTEMVEYAKERKAVKGEMVKSSVADVSADDFDDFDRLPDDGPDNEEWHSELQIADDGSIKATFLNATIIMHNDADLRNRMGYNEMAMRVEKGRTCEMWSAKDSYLVRKLIGRRYGVDFPEGKVEHAIEDRAHELTFHPVREYLESLEWDGVERVDGFFARVFPGLEDGTYVREVSRCWILAAVWRVMEPGFKFDHVPVLGGEQGIGKTTLVETMASRYDWYGELTSFDPKIAMEEIGGKWIVELNEMGATNRHELEQQKAFISARATTARPAYARHKVEYKRQCVFIGTINETEYLKDSTGNRRWWPLDCGDEQMDLDWLRENVDQVWAEAFKRVAIGGELPTMSREAQAIAAEQQEAKRVSDDWEGRIAEWLESDARADRYDGPGFDDEMVGSAMETRNKVCVAEILEDCMGIPKDRIKPQDRRRVASAMRSVKGWEQSANPMRFGLRFGRQKGWVRKAPF